MSSKWLKCVGLTLLAATMAINGHGGGEGGEQPLPENALAKEKGQLDSSAQGDLVRMTINEAKIQDVLESLAALRPGVNIITAPEVQGTVSLLTLRDVSWDTALELVADALALEVVKEKENLYRIRRPRQQVAEKLVVELLTEADVAELSDAQVADLLDSAGNRAAVSTPAAREQLRQQAGQFVRSLVVEEQPAVKVINALAKKSGLNFSFATSPSIIRVETEDSKQPAETFQVKLPPVTLNLRLMRVVDAIRLVASQGGLSSNLQNGVWVFAPQSAKKLQSEPLVMETFQVDFLPLDKSLVEVCRGLVSERGEVSAGKNKVLIVRDTADGIEAVRRALEVMDKATPQVLIEARFFELSDGARKDLGIDWKQLGGDGDGLVLNADFAAGQLTDSLKNRVKAATLNVSDLGVVLKALQEDSGVKQLANPKILVSSEEQATIHIGEQRPIIKSSLETDASGNKITTYELDPAYGGEKIQSEQLVTREQHQSQARDYTVRKGYLDLGTKLTVAPSVKTDNEVYIKVIPELTSILREIELTSGDTTIQYPVLFSTRVRTEFTVQSNQTIAIGGLVNERESSGRRRVPGLGHIPLLGRLFRYDYKEKTQSETIVFLTVKIVPSQELTAKSGVPIRSYLAEPEIERIEKEDAEGSSYDSERARDVLRQIEAEAEAQQWSAEKIRQTIAERLGLVRKPGEGLVEPLPLGHEPLSEPPAPAAGMGLKVSAQITVPEA